MFKKNVSKGPQVGPLAQLCQSKIGSIQFWQVLYSVHDPESLLSIHNFLEPPWFEHRVHVVTTSLVDTAWNFISHHVPPLGKPENMTCPAMFTCRLINVTISDHLYTAKSLSAQHVYFLIYQSRQTTCFRGRNNTTHLSNLRTVRRNNRWSSKGTHIWNDHLRQDWDYLRAQKQHIHTHPCKHHVNVIKHTP